MDYEDGFDSADWADADAIKGQYVCTACHADFDYMFLKPKRTFLGFSRVMCPECDHDILYPLTTFNRVAYIIILLVAVAASVWWLIDGDIPYPAIAAIGAGLILSKDATVRKTIKGAWTRNEALAERRDAPRPPGPVPPPLP